MLVYIGPHWTLCNSRGQRGQICRKSAAIVSLYCGGGSGWLLKYLMHLTHQQCDTIIQWCQHHWDRATRPRADHDRYVHRTLRSTPTWCDQDLVDLMPLTVSDLFVAPITCTVTLFQPGTITPPHQDTHRTHRERHHVPSHHIIDRLWIPLTEPHLGHVLMYEHQVIWSQPQGHGMWLPRDQDHSGCNLGWVDRWLLTVDGQQPASHCDK